MKRLLCLVFAVFVWGCSCVDEDVVNSTAILSRNTKALAKNYVALIERSGPPAARPGESSEDAARREAAWTEQAAHDKALMAANAALAERLHTWALAKAGRDDEGE